MNLKKELGEIPINFILIEDDNLVKIKFQSESDEYVDGCTVDAVIEFIQLILDKKIEQTGNKKLSNVKSFLDNASYALIRNDIKDNELV